MTAFSRYGRILQVFALFSALSAVVPKDAVAVSLWPFSDPVGDLIERARRARVEGELNLAASILSEVSDVGEAKVDYRLEVARLLVAQGRLEEGASAFRAIAKSDPGSPAREELAAVLVELGRWPEAIGELERAFEERSGTLSGKGVADDPRFAPLAALEPFGELIDRVRESQAGPLGRMVLRLERVEESVQETVATLERLSEFARRVSAILTSTVVPLFAFVFLGICCTFACAQWSSLPRGPRVVAGQILATVVWLSGAQSFTGDFRSGVYSASVGTAFVFSVALVLAALTWGLGKLRRRRRSGS